MPALTAAAPVAEAPTTDQIISRLRMCVKELLHDIDGLRDEIKNATTFGADDLIGWCDTTIANVDFDYGEVLNVDRS